MHQSEVYKHIMDRIVADRRLKEGRRQGDKIPDIPPRNESVFQLVIGFISGAVTVLTTSIVVIFIKKLVI